MKCRECKKEITGKYIKADGHVYHPQCFICAKCRKVIRGKYQDHRGKNYHPHCYNEITGLTCDKCGKLLEGSYAQRGKKKYHPDCVGYPLCDVCGQPMKTEYVYNKEGKYHEQCFLNRKAPRCDVCEGPITGSYMKDPWGNQSHERHNGQSVISCDHCSRFVSDATSNGGQRYSDGRVVCGICNLTAVTKNNQVRTSLSRVLSILSSSPSGFREIPGGVPIELANRSTLKRLARTHFLEHGQGFTWSNITLQDNKRIKAQYRIYLLYGMPRLQFEAVLAHELLHVWLIHRDSRLSDKLTEGFCNLGSALVYQSDGGAYARLMLKQMEENPHRLYGKGYRAMSRKLHQVGWKRLKASM
ncbi:MAG: protein DA1 [bacterium]|nr:protein DA1 [bacterium]